jgi:uncharacterized protein with gpF-like domain
MSLRIPQNKIQFKYTIGNEYIYADSYKNYQGHYYEINNSFFAGKEFKLNAPILIKKDSSNINLLKSNPKTVEYANISGTKLTNQKITSYYFNPDTTDNVFRYFTKKINENIIKEINEDNFNLIKNNLMYASVSLYYQSNFNENELNEAEKKIPGLKEYINSTYTPGVTD